MAHPQDLADVGQNQNTANRPTSMMETIQSIHNGCMKWHMFIIGVTKGTLFFRSAVFCPEGHDRWRKSFCLLCCTMIKDITDSLTLWLGSGPWCRRPWLNILWENVKQSVVTDDSSAPGSWQTSDRSAQSSLSCFLPSLHVSRVCGAPLISILFFRGTRTKCNLSTGFALLSRITVWP